MAIATVKQLCTPNAVVTSDSLVEQVAQLDDFASGKIEGREFFRRNHFTAGLELLVKRGFERLAGKTDDGAFYLTQAMGGGKTHSLIAFGLLAANPELRKEVLPHLASAGDFGAAEAGRIGCDVYASDLIYISGVLRGLPSNLTGGSYN